MLNIFRRKRDTARERERESSDRRTDRAVSHSCLALAVLHEPHKPNGTGTARSKMGGLTLPPTHFYKLYQSRLRPRFKETACVRTQLSEPFREREREFNGGQQLAQTKRSLSPLNSL